MRTRFTVLGLVLVLLGFYALVTITSLVRAYIAKPDAQNGGILILSRFVHISYATALGIAGAAGFLILVGIFIIFRRNSKTDPSIDHLATLAFDRLGSIVYGPLARFCMVEARRDD